MTALRNEFKRQSSNNGGYYDEEGHDGPDLEAVVLDGHYNFERVVDVIIAASVIERSER